MTEAQTWAAIGASTTAFFATLTIISWLFVHVIRAEVGKPGAELRGEIEALRHEMRGEIAALRGDMNAMNARLSGEIAAVRGEMNAMDARLSGEIAKIATKLEHLDRDVQAIVRREFGDPS